VGNYESFLFLLGSVFVPLFGVFVADYFVLRRKGRASSIPAFASWIVGFLIYQWSWTVPPGLEGWRSAMDTLFREWLHLPYPLAGSRWGASIPAFLAALVLHSLLAWTVRRRTERDHVR
jgi:nucleobase:cation symporter-1, NCS1 family